MKCESCGLRMNPATDYYITVNEFSKPRPASIELLTADADAVCCTWSCVIDLAEQKLDDMTYPERHRRGEHATFRSGD